MNLILYSNGANGTAKRLLDAITGLNRKLETEIFQSVADLVKRFRKGKKDISVLILCADTREELAEILGIHPLLRDLRTILILPDRESGTLAQGLTLRPRFFSFVDTDFKDVSAVLARMLKIQGGAGIEKGKNAECREDSVG